MSALPLPLPESAQRTETILRALADMAKDFSLPLDIRQRAAKAHSIMHPCRDPAVVRALERERGLA